MTAAAASCHRKRLLQIVAHRSALGSVGDRLRASMAPLLSPWSSSPMTKRRLGFRRRVQGVLSHRLVP